jgi:predicted MFS family arabinose efflux permease
MCPYRDTLCGMTVTYQRVFANTEFRWLWTAHVLSVGGDQLARLALTVLVFHHTGSPGWAAMTYAITYVPDLIGGTTLSGFADRFDRRTVMVVSDIARAALVAGMAIPGVPLAGQVVLLIVVQLLAAPFSSARQAVLPDILPGDQLAVGLGVIGMTYQAGLVLGFGAGAAVLTSLGTSGALWVDTATFAVSAVVIGLGVRRHRPARAQQQASQPAAPTSTRSGQEVTASEPQPAGRWRSMTAGVRFVAGDARLRALLGIACCAGCYVVPEGLAVPYAAQLGAGTAGVGWLLAANPVGTVLGLVVLKRMSPDRRLRWLGPLAVATSAVLLPTGWAPVLPVTVLLWAASGALSAHDMITQSAYVTAAPAHARGQAVGVAIAGLRTAQGLGIAAAGWAAVAISPSVVIAAAALLGVGVAAAAARAWSRSTSPEPAAMRLGETTTDNTGTIE